MFKVSAENLEKYLLPHDYWDKYLVYLPKMARGIVEQKEEGSFSIALGNVLGWGYFILALGIHGKPYIMWYQWEQPTK